MPRRPRRSRKDAGGQRVERGIVRCAEWTPKFEHDERWCACLSFGPRLSRAAQAVTHPDAGCPLNGLRRHYGAPAVVEQQPAGYQSHRPAGSLPDAYSAERVGAPSSAPPGDAAPNDRDPSWRPAQRGSLASRARQRTGGRDLVLTATADPPTSSSRCGSAPASRHSRIVGKTRQRPIPRRLDALRPRQLSRHQC